MTGRLRITLLGSGSSGGVPRVGGDWGVCDPSEPRNRRTRCGLLVERFDEGSQNRTTVLIDTSPDLREQLLKADVKRVDAIVYTHDHADQTHGIDDVRALVLSGGRRVPVFMDPATHKTLEARFRYVFSGSKGYPPLLAIQPDFEPGRPFSVEGPGGSIAFTPLLQDHGPAVSYGFRFGPAAYSNDMVDLPEETLQHLTGLELWIADALRYEPHPTHAHLARTLAWVHRLRPRRTTLTNLHIDMDFARLSAELPAGVEAGYDGWRTTLHL
jgi:phosphoribosyl 1,2-cyclic phosphate phosphodiesterase